MQIKLFTQDQCPNCPPAKNLARKLKDKGFSVTHHDIKTPDGLAESLMRDVMSTPSIIITKNNAEIAGWRGTVPEKTEIMKHLENPD